MACAQQAVLDFDEEILAPWRPRLVAMAGAVEDGTGRPVPSRSSGRSSSRVGICRPPDPRVSSASREATVAPRAPWAPRGPEGARRQASPLAARRSPGRLRLTRRARLLGVTLALVLGVAIGSWLGPLLAGPGADLRLAGAESVVVQPGDSLWSIAGKVAGSSDVREVIDRIQEINGLSGTVLIPGQVLELP